MQRKRRHGQRVSLTSSPLGELTGPRGSSYETYRAMFLWSSKFTAEVERTSSPYQSQILFSMYYASAVYIYAWSLPAGAHCTTKKQTHPLRPILTSSTTHTHPRTWCLIACCEVYIALCRGHQGAVQTSHPPVQAHVPCIASMLARNRDCQTPRNTAADQGFCFVSPRPRDSPENCLASAHPM